MRILVFFDLPVGTPVQRREAAQFRKSLIQDGYYMMQFSVYGRLCNGLDSIGKHRERLTAALPDNGSVRMMVVTEKQYASMEILLGNYQPDEEAEGPVQISFF